MKGNTGAIAHVDLGSGTVNIIRYPAEIYTRFIGGSGMAAKLYMDRADHSLEPLSPESPLIFMNGPLAGVRLSGASRICAAARSPLTGTFADCSCGGFFPPSLKQQGYDGLFITGRAGTPSLLLLKGGRIIIEDARELWGKGNIETSKSLKEHFGRASTSLTIGPAGENAVPYACILNDAHNAFGRCGLGAVMGSKNLKAIVVAERKAGDPDYADGARLKELIREVTPRIKESMISMVLHDFGSAGNLEGHIYTGDVPIKNWQSNFNEKMAEALTGSTMTEKYSRGTKTCAYCAVACKQMIKIDEPPFSIPEGPGPEYETVAAFGTLLDSSNLAAACKANYLCNDLGMDTITTGSTIAWAMEAWEKGALAAPQTEDIPLEWGDMETVIHTLLPAIAAREGRLGKLLAKGSARAAKEIGSGSLEYTTHCKGLEAPMHDPRGGGHGHALAYAISPRGACHVATAMHFMETGACNYPEIGFEFDLEAMTHEKKPETAVLAAALGAIENSACLCQYADRSLTIQEIVDLLNAAAGYDLSIETLMEAGSRIFHLKRCINYHLGFRASDDLLTGRMLEPARDGEPEGIEIKFDEMKSAFYRLMHMDPVKGVATKERLMELALFEEAEKIWSRQ